MKALVEALTLGKQDFNHLIQLIITFGMVQFISALASQYSAYINTIHQQALTDYLSSEVLNKAVVVDYEYYENPGYHDTLHLAQQQSLYRAGTLLNNFNTALLNSLSLVFLIGFFFSLNPLFAGMFVALCIPLAIIKWYSGFALLRLERGFAPLEREANYLHSSLTGVTSAKEVRVFGFGASFIQKFNKIRQYIHQEKKRMHLKLTWFSLLAEAIEIVVMTVIFCMLAKYTWQKMITIGAFVIYIQGFQRLQTTAKSFLQSMVQILQHRIFLKDLFAFFDIKTSQQESGKAMGNDRAQGLVVNNVSFTYPQTTRQVLFDVSMSCKPGGIIAIVGENGSGKSTLVKLIARLYQVQQGKILMNGDQLSDIGINDFRNDSIFLFQDFEKYFLTVSENIALGHDANENSDDAIEKAAHLSGAHEFISRLSNGYKTRMGRLFEGSEQLSGGQWQKMAIARIFYKKAQLVVLDEPTSALDATAENEVFANVKKELKDQMVILISHRLYNLKIADYIYVMKDGAVAQHGSFEALIAKEGLFKTMYDAQKL